MSTVNSVMANPTAARLAAVDLLLTPGPDGHAHPRAAAFLLRRALEEHLDTYLSLRHQALPRCRAETKAVWLAHYLGPDTAGRLATVWHNLSAACHHHQATLPPSTTELRSWRQEVAHVVRAMGS